MATEAVSALLSFADEADDGEMLCLMDPGNVASRRVADKASVDGISVSSVPASGTNSDQLAA